MSPKIGQDESAEICQQSCHHNRICWRSWQRICQKIVGTRCQCLPLWCQPKSGLKIALFANLMLILIWLRIVYISWRARQHYSSIKMFFKGFVTKVPLINYIMPIWTRFDALSSPHKPSMPSPICPGIKLKYSYIVDNGA